MRNDFGAKKNACSRNKSALIGFHLGVIENYLSCLYQRIEVLVEFPFKWNSVVTLFWPHTFFHSIELFLQGLELVTG